MLVDHFTSVVKIFDARRHMTEHRLVWQGVPRPLLALRGPGRASTAHHAGPLRCPSRVHPSQHC